MSHIPHGWETFLASGRPIYFIRRISTDEERDGRRGSEDGRAPASAAVASNSFQVFGIVACKAPLSARFHRSVREYTRDENTLSMMNEAQDIGQGLLNAFHGKLTPEEVERTVLEHARRTVVRQLKIWDIPQLPPNVQLLINLCQTEKYYHPSSFLAPSSPTNTFTQGSTHAAPPSHTLGEAEESAASTAISSTASELRDDEMGGTGESETEETVVAARETPKRDYFFGCLRGSGLEPDRRTIDAIIDRVLSFVLESQEDPNAHIQFQGTRHIPSADDLSDEEYQNLRTLVADRRDLIPLAAIHCTHGVNRTGLICSLLMCLLDKRKYPKIVVLKAHSAHSCETRDQTFHL